MTTWSTGCVSFVLVSCPSVYITSIREDVQYTVADESPPEDKTVSNGATKRGAKDSRSRIWV